MDESTGTDRFTITVKSAWGDTWTWIGVDHLATQQVYDKLGAPNDVSLIGKHLHPSHGGRSPLDSSPSEPPTERVRWRMTLEELCHRVKARPQDLEEWARLGALGPRWKETTENKWRHITRAAARRAVVMRAMLTAGLEPSEAALVADEHADALGRGEQVSFQLGSARVLLDPQVLDMP